MASSAFKSTSKRGNLNSSIPQYNRDSNYTQKTSPSRKRSSSVSAVSRAKQSLDISTDYFNKIENPLFWTSVSSPTDKKINEISATVKRTEKEKERGKNCVESTTKKGSGKTASTDQRGRSVTRSSGVKSGIGRSMSRDRGRSVSKGHYRAYESEEKQEVANVASSRNSDLKQVFYNGKNDNMVKNGADIWECIRELQRVNSLCQANDCSEDDSSCSFQISNWEDGISTRSLSEAEEKTIETVYEQMKSFQDERWGVDTFGNGIYETGRSEVRRAISDIQDDVESSKERARKFRADLAVEEHRGQELRRVLEEILPDLKTSNRQKSRMGRKSSERKKISKRLTEEAMAYFDECVSISTFDSSDFSAPEDLPRRSTGPPNPFSSTVSVPGGSSSINLPLDALDNYSNNQQAVLGGNGQQNSCEDSNLTANSSSYEPTTDQADQRDNSMGNSERHQFSFAQKPKEYVKFHDIKKYTQHFETGENRNTVIADGRRQDYDTDEHDLHGHLERLLFDRVFFRNRIESGGLHLCAGNLAVPFSFFGSVI